MKTFISILLLLLPFSSIAQKIRFSDNRNQGTTLGFASDTQPFQNVFIFGTDTLAYGMIYKPIHNLQHPYFCGWFTGCSGGGGPLLNFLIREDTIAHIVYCRNVSAYTTDTLEHILYNYNFNIGDSINYKGFIDTVASIDSTLINGIYHKIFNFQNKAHGRSYTVLEGVGCTNNPVFPASFGACFEYGESLFCFSQNGVRPAIHAPINSRARFATGCCYSIDGSVF